MTPDSGATRRWRARDIAAAAVRPFLPATEPTEDHRSGKIRPTWRGRQHALALLAAIPASAVAVAVAPPGRRWPMAVYGGTLVATLATSAAYHTLATTPKGQAAMSRADRATVYALIAGTTTPALVYTSTPRRAAWVLGATWLGAAVGATARATGTVPRLATAGYVALGWAGALTAVRVWRVSPTATVLLTAGGVAYTAGASMYATKRPVLRPETYGYHEAFHSLTLAGFTTHYAAVLLLAIRARQAGAVAAAN